MVALSSLRWFLSIVWTLLLLSHYGRTFEEEIKKVFDCAEMTNGCNNARIDLFSNYQSVNCIRRTTKSKKITDVCINSSFIFHPGSSFETFECDGCQNIRLELHDSEERTLLSSSSLQCNSNGDPPGCIDVSITMKNNWNLTVHCGKSGKNCDGINITLNSNEQSWITLLSDIDDDHYSTLSTNGRIKTSLRISPKRYSIHLSNDDDDYNQYNNNNNNNDENTTDYSSLNNRQLASGLDGFINGLSPLWLIGLLVVAFIFGLCLTLILVWICEQADCCQWCGFCQMFRNSNTVNIQANYNSDPGSHGRRGNHTKKKKSKKQRKQKKKSDPNSKTVPLLADTDEMTAAEMAVEQSLISGTQVSTQSSSILSDYNIELISRDFDSTPGGGSSKKKKKISTASSLMSAATQSSVGHMMKDRLSREEKAHELVIEEPFDLPPRPQPKIGELPEIRSSTATAFSEVEGAQSTTVTGDTLGTIGTLAGSSSSSSSSSASSSSSSSKVMKTTTLTSGATAGGRRSGRSSDSDQSFSDESDEEIKHQGTGFSNFDVNETSRALGLSLPGSFDDHRSTDASKISDFSGVDSKIERSETVFSEGFEAMYAPFSRPSNIVNPEDPTPM